MPQLSLYLNSATMNTLRCNAARENKSLSRFVAELLERPYENAYPSSFWATYGAMTDPTFVVPDDIDPSIDGPVPSFD